MKVKTSVSLSAELLAEIDRAAGEEISRSEFIEKALRQHFRLRRREERDRRDAEIYARVSLEELRDAEEWLAFQPDLEGFGDDADRLLAPESRREAG